jgi:hypothetical protein
MESGVKSVTGYMMIGVQNVTMVSIPYRAKERNFLSYKHYKSTIKIGREKEANIINLARLRRITNRV